MTLVEFLNARLDEAKADAVKAGGDRWIHDGGIHHESHVSDDVVDWVYGEASEHIARNDPAYVLADIAAKRMIIAAEMDRVGAVHEFIDEEMAARIRGRADSRVLRALASVYSEHAEFNPEWKP